MCVCSHIHISICAWTEIEQICFAEFLIAVLIHSDLCEICLLVSQNPFIPVTLLKPIPA